MNKTIAIAAILSLAGCQQSPPAASNADVPAPVIEAAPAESSVPAPATQAPAPAQSDAAVDPKSAEAAAQVVQQYATLVEQKRFADAEKLWGDPAAAKAATKGLDIYASLDVQVGAPGGMEGAAGSSYVNVPVTMNGRLESSGIRHREGTAVLRRVNDVPGSTEAQRRWHIERIDWKF